MTTYRINDPTGKVEELGSPDCLGEPASARFALGSMVLLVGTTRIYVVCDHEIRLGDLGPDREESDGKKRANLRYLVQQVYIRDSKGLLTPCEVDEPEWRFDHELQPLPPGSRLLEPPQPHRGPRELTGLIGPGSSPPAPRRLPVDTARRLALLPGPRPKLLT